MYTVARPQFFLFYLKRRCRRGASLLFWVKFIYTAGVASLCDMVGMCTGMSSALCSPGLPPLFPSRTCSSPPLVSHLIQYPGYHGVLIIRASIALGPSEGASLMHTHSSKYAFFKVSSIGIYNERYLLAISLWVVASIVARFSQVLQRHSHDLCRFSLLDVPSWWRRQLHVVCAILYV